MSVLLALDSSTEHMALALGGQGHAAFVDAPGGAQASQTLVPQALALLAQAGLRLADVQAVAFGRGPGAFTGLRTACAVAQGLALGAGKPVLALDSLMLVAEDARQQHGEAAHDVCVAMDARMNQIYLGHYRWNGAGWETLAAPSLTDPAPLQALWAAQPPVCVAGSALDEFSLETGGALRVPHTASRARALGALAAQAWVAGLAEDAALALPLYVRDKVAQTTDERRAAATGAKAAADATATITAAGATASAGGAGGTGGTGATAAAVAAAVPAAPEGRDAVPGAATP